MNQDALDIPESQREKFLNPNRRTVLKNIDKIFAKLLFQISQGWNKRIVPRLHLCYYYIYVLHVQQFKHCLIVKHIFGM